MIGFDDEPYAQQEQRRLAHETKQALHQVNCQLACLRFGMREQRRQDRQLLAMYLAHERLLSRRARTLHQEYRIFRQI